MREVPNLDPTRSRFLRERAQAQPDLVMRSLSLEDSESGRSADTIVGALR